MRTQARARQGAPDKPKRPGSHSFGNKAPEHMIARGRRTGRMRTQQCALQGRISSVIRECMARKLHAAHMPC